MGQYSIKELEQLTGIKAHTIRIWESRYGILKPKRSETNIRTYDDDDLKHILNVSLLNQNGYKISKIACMSVCQIGDAILSLSESREECPHQISALVAAMVEMNEERFDKVLSTVILQKGFEAAVNLLVLPFLKKIGILWQTGNINPAHEHFVSNIIRQKFIVAIDGQIILSGSDVPRFILFLPEGELHELGLLFMQYILRTRQVRVLYLGQNLPLADLIKAYEGFRPNYFCTIITSVPARAELQAYLNALAAQFPDSGFFVSGYQFVCNEIILPSNFKYITDMQAFSREVDTLIAEPVFS
ncbi:helix-turn-helix-type transcriptional regulator [Adhaeribacter arboris]|uniref:Helix-turn-helix-type transcriptional regulator n=1 Tax=Adhaeribacter arboris TaxID=2072846 RepID=A0A2T2Y9P8_9BACT|nr:MerR family transcriptional regulator [Adhaeribacter arboris]PSR52216.1 helix-turn-helix-type transcriptional regulator [Adhaeribacter arboris]